MERYTVYFADDTTPVKEEILNIMKNRKYGKYFVLQKGEILYYIYDNKKNCLVGFCNARPFKRQIKHESYISKENGIYVNFLKVFNSKDTKDEDYTKHGFGSLLLDKINTYAKEHNISKIFLIPMTKGVQKFYWENGFVSKSIHGQMIKETDETNWLCACVLNECMHRAMKNHTRVGDEVMQLIENKDYDNILEYIKEDCNSKNYSPHEAWHDFDRKLQDRLLNSIQFPKAIAEIQKVVESDNYFNELKCYYSRRKLIGGKTPVEKHSNKVVRNICADVYLIERDKLINAASERKRENVR